MEQTKETPPKDPPSSLENQCETPNLIVSSSKSVILSEDQFIANKVILHDNFEHEQPLIVTDYQLQDLSDSFQITCVPNTENELQ